MMTQTEILECNHRIALFMGAKITFARQGAVYFFPGNVSGWSLKDFRYHDSWDALMPVVDKIWRDSRSAMAISISNADVAAHHNDKCKIFYTWYNDNSIFNCVYAAVLHLIEIYNCIALEPAHTVQENSPLIF